MGVSHSGLAIRFFAVRYMRLISGRANLSNRAFRTKAFLKAIKKKSARRPKNPFSIDLLEWLFADWFGDHEVTDPKICILDAIAIGFSFACGFLRCEMYDAEMYPFREDNLHRLSTFSQNRRIASAASVLRELLRGIIIVSARYVDYPNG